jgi:hypothetical protein
MVGGTVQAAITYVDITDGVSGNTMMYSNALWQPWTAFNGQTANSNDGIWDRRAFGNSATIFQNAANALVDTNATRLRTTITVPTPSPYQYYNVYALFWTDSSTTWAAGASLIDYPGPLPTYRQSSPGVRRFWASTTDSATIYSTNLSPNLFATPVMISEGNRRLLMTPVLGRVYGSTITVYTGPNPDQNGSDTRTWFDGIGYELIANQIVATQILPNGNLSLGYSGTAGRQYTWEWTDSLEPPVTWTPLQTSTANAFGLVNFTNPPSSSTEFYRVHDVTPPPTAVSNLTATAGVAQVSLSWAASALAMSYNVKQATTSGGPYTTITNVTRTSFVNTGLVNGTTYFYAVSALNYDGESGNSPIASATPFPPQPPPTPTGLTAAPGNNLVLLSWSASAGVTNYNVKRATVSGGPYTTITNVAATSFGDTGLSNATTYYYVVSALNDFGESVDSAQMNSTPFDTPPLVYPVEFTGTNFPVPPLPTLANLPVIQPLPDPFCWANDPTNALGTRSISFYDWSHHRVEIKAQIENYEIGTKPAVDPTNIFASYSAGTLTVRVTNVVSGTPRTLTLTCAVSLPAGPGPFPAIIGMNSPSGSIPSSLLTSRNIARITFSHNQVTIYGNQQNTDPYYQLYGPALNNSNTGQYSAWAWGVSRIIDGLQLVTNTLPIDLNRIAVTGCSYAGKMALFSGAFDERVALTIAQESGGGGANSWRHNQTEPAGTVEKIDNTDHNWFSEGMFQFSGANVSRLPEDHHMLAAMIAPRALFATGNPDFTWLGNPSHYVTCRAVERIYNTWGIGERFGFNIIGGHNHCATTASIEAEMGAFLDKFMLGNTNVNTVIRDYPGSYSSINYSSWTAWWGTTNAIFGP